MGGVVTYEELVTLDRFKSAYPGSVPCVVDVGANVGDYLAEVFGRFPRAIAYAFEPQAAAAAEIRSRFASKHVIVEQCGLSDAPGRAELHASDSEACVLATLYERPDADSYHGTGVALNRRERVRLETLDRMIDGMPVDWLKIDVEGHELAVLRGGERLLAHTSVVQFEFNDCARIAGVRFADLLRYPTVDDFKWGGRFYNDRSRTPLVQQRDQRIRELWRALVLVVKARLESVESGIESFEQAFLPYIQLPDGQTAGEFLIPQVEAAYELGEMPSLLPAASNRQLSRGEIE
jgi:FkbM family methyltransferase